MCEKEDYLYETMHKISRKGFVHSIKVPRLYKVASVIYKKVVEEGGSLKDLVYSSGHKNIKGIYALVVKTIEHSKELDVLIKNSKLLERETGLQPWLAKILITELLYGKKTLKGESKPVKIVLSYKKEFENLVCIRKTDLEINNAIAKKPRYVRVNTLHYTPDEVIKIFRIEGWTFCPLSSDYSSFLEIVSNLKSDTFTRDFHIKELLVFPNCAQFYENALYQNGSILLQDKASCLPAVLLKPKTNSIVLDMCAAPGMKTTHLSAIARNKGQIYAVEIDSRRYKALCDVIESAGCTNITPVHTDALKINGNEKNEDYPWAQDVEYILVDPSCSGSGIVERKKIFKNEKTDPQRLQKLCRFQFRLLMHALSNFPKVKRVVYSTCSVLPEENEMVVEDVLKKLNNMDNDNDESKFQLADPLKTSWLRRGSDDYEHGRHCIFSDPEKDLTNGFFVAVFEKVKNEIFVKEGSEDTNIFEEKSKRKKLKKSD